MTEIALGRPGPHRGLSPHVLLRRASQNEAGTRIELSGLEPCGDAPLGDYAGCVQKRQRLASIGISLRHSLHFLVVGAAAGLAILAASVFMGRTTKK